MALSRNYGKYKVNLLCFIGNLCKKCGSKKKKKKNFFGIKQKNGNFKPSIPFLHRKTTNFTGLWA
jgi:hypothetical protein